MSGATARLDRIVALVAELSRRADDEMVGVPLGEIAARFDATVADIEGDIRILTALGESAADDWLLSFGIWQEGDRLGVSSGGAFRRPIRLTPEEVLALRVGLAADPSDAARMSPALREALMAGDDETPPPVAVATPGGDPDRLLDLLLGAIRDECRVAIDYQGAADRAPARRVVHPYRVLGFQDWRYLVAWCESAGGWRRFRLDRIHGAERLGSTFTPRDDDEVEVHASAVYRDPEDAEPDSVRVRFAPHVARWLAERHPEAERGADDSLVVTYRVAGEDWLVRHVLQYGDGAEVLEPAEYRRRMREAVRGR